MDFFNKSERVILGLTRPVAERVVSKYEKYLPYIVNMDRYFTSPMLCRAMRFYRGMFVNGTVQCNRKNVPKDDIKLKKSETGRGFYKFVQTVTNDIILCCWRDRNIVAVCFWDQEEQHSADFRKIFWIPKKTPDLSRNHPILPQVHGRGGHI